MPEAKNIAISAAVVRLTGQRRLTAQRHTHNKANLPMSHIADENRRFTARRTG
ncbi:hypothetical protein HMPREF0198_1994 [Cardiobacterium hominis ATCC 15826]|uniref:Uncharacterized protein n=1 Tax=Cardiobacterium hominis (strain ATCC 15826 / DSM 8339 / NCTC 10426 / 6573) TaxID=638300 RepID=C8NBW6_CARH6|nr:hypothetical protein HMPREF0198_1994 [Cardiobacterium hominis ATCC 15826]